MAIFPGAVATDTDLLVGANFKTALVTDNPLSNVATTVNVNSTSGFPTVGALLIDSELIKYTGTTATSFTGCTRGFDGTSAVSHVLNSQVRLVITAQHHNGLKDEVKALEQNLSDRLGLGSVAVSIGDLVTSVSRTRSTAGTTSSIDVGQTDNTNVNSHARLNLSVGGANGGSTFVRFDVGAIDFSLGVDNSDNDRFKISRAAIVGTVDRFVLDASGWGAMGPNPSYTANFFTLRTNAAENAQFWARVNNATGDPGLMLTTDAVDWIMGIDNSVSDNFTISASTSLGVNDRFRMSTAGNTLWLGTSFTHGTSNIGGETRFSIENSDGTNAASAVRIAMKVIAGGGDSYVFWDGPTDWSLGLDNSDNDKWQLCRQTGVGGNVKWSMHPDGRFALGTANPEAYNSNADDFVISNSGGVVGMTLRCATNSSNILAFTDAEGTAVQGLLQYDHQSTAASERLTIRVGGTDVGEICGGGIRFVQTAGFTAGDGTNSFTVGTIEANFLLIAKGYALVFVSGQFTTGGTVTGSLLSIGGFSTIASNYNFVNAGTITGYAHGLVTTNGGGDPRGLLSPTITSGTSLRWQRANGATWAASTVYNFHCTVMAQIA